MPSDETPTGAIFKLDMFRVTDTNRIEGVHHYVAKSKAGIWRVHRTSDDRLVAGIAPTPDPHTAGTMMEFADAQAEHFIKVGRQQVHDDAAMLRVAAVTATARAATAARLSDQALQPTTSGEGE